jgi:predicted amidophosphoribosyltransferase
VLVDLLLPRRCVACGSTGGGQLCTACRDALPRLTPPLCARCGAPVQWPVERCRECSGRRLAFESARAAVTYDDEVRRIVRGWKERGLRHLAAALAEVVASQVERPPAEVVTFVPGDPWRTRERGHHPAERLAKALARAWHLPCEPLLRRAGDGRRQSRLSATERRRNPQFVAIAAAGAVLVDDVYTTGATANAAARALGGRGIRVVTFARTVRRG